MEDQIHIKPQMLFQWIESHDDFLLIDIREPEERAVAHLGGISIPLNQLFNADLPKDITIVLYCRSGIRSLAAAKQLYEKGFQRVFSLEGGLVAFKKAFSQAIHH